MMKVRSLPPQHPENKSEAPEDPENLSLRNRPSKSIRAKIVVAFSLFFILCLAIACWSSWVLSKLEDKINFLEITDSYMAEIQQARRFEKNYLLYSTDLEEALEHLQKANSILREQSVLIENIQSREHFNMMVDYMSKYRNQLTLLGQARDDAEKESLVPMLRQYGSQMVSLAEEIVKKERYAIARGLTLTKRVPLVFIFLLFILMIAVLSSLIRQLMTTLKRFMDYTKRIGEGDFSPILPVRKYRDEFSQLAEAFNRMIREINHRQNILLESHKLRAIGTLVAGVAHELNNPLNNTLLTASVLQEDFDQLSEREKLDMIDELISETERSRVIVKNLLDFARESETNIKPLNIKIIINDSIRLVGNQIKLAKIKLEARVKENLPMIHGDEQMLKQVLVNLILNAADALPPGGKIQIGVQENGPAGYLVVTVQDNGPGIPGYIQSRIFEPFFTTKRQGTGLGLAVSRGLIRKLGGNILLDSSSTNGTTFSILLPVTQAPSDIMLR